MGDPRHLRDLGRSQGVHFTFPFLWILSKIIPRHLHPVLSIHNSHCRAYGEHSCYENLMRAGGYFKLRCLVWPFTTTRTCSVLLPRFNVQKTGGPDLEASRAASVSRDQTYLVRLRQSLKMQPLPPRGEWETQLKPQEDLVDRLSPSAFESHRI